MQTADIVTGHVTEVTTGAPRGTKIHTQSSYDKKFASRSLQMGQDDMNELEWAKETNVPHDAIPDRDWVTKVTYRTEVRARVVSKDKAMTKQGDLHAPTPTSVPIRCLLFYAAGDDLDMSTSNVKEAFTQKQRQNQSVRHHHFHRNHPVGDE